MYLCVGRSKVQRASAAARRQRGSAIRQQLKCAAEVASAARGVQRRPIRGGGERACMIGDLKHVRVLSDCVGADHLLPAGAITAQRPTAAIVSRTHIKYLVENAPSLGVSLVDQLGVGRLCQQGDEIGA